MSELESTTGLVALAAGAAALLALLWVGVLSVRLRRIRAAQRTVLGGEERDVVSHAAALEQRVEAEAEAIEAAAARLGERLANVEQRLQSVISHFAVIRYDAYNEMTGRQSSSIALLDEGGSGIVLSSILHREQARFYAKWIVDGRSELDLSPEEREAIDEAMAGGRGRASQEPPARHPPGGSAR